MSKVLIVKYDTDEFEEYYNNLARENDIEVLPISFFDGTKAVGFWDKIKRFFKLCFIPKKAVEGFDIIVIFDNMILVPFLKLKANWHTRIIYWRWNILTEAEAHKLWYVKPFCELWTFDEFDSKKYGMNLNNQFYGIIPQRELPAPKYIKRAFCVCVDKGRYEELGEIRKLLIKYNVICDFILVKEKNKNYNPCDSEWIKDEGISYSEFVERTINSDLVVDLVQHSQVGITVRVLEALFYNKKLITNNIAVKQYPFYNPSNVFIYGSDDELRIREFLESPYVEISKEIKEQYLIDQWIRNFIKENKEPTEYPK